MKLQVVDTKGEVQEVTDLFKVTKLPNGGVMIDIEGDFVIRSNGNIVNLSKGKQIYYGEEIHLNPNLKSNKNGKLTFNLREEEIENG